MATKQTQNYGLNQWELSDSVVMADFNADNQKVDTALKNLQQSMELELTTLDQKATASINQVNATLDQKFTAAVNRIDATLSQLVASMPHVQSGTYIGTGTYGPSNPNKITLNFTPKLIIVEQNTVSGTDWFHLFAVQGNNRTFARYTSSSSSALATPLTWSGKTLSWYATESAQRQGNVKDVIYHYIAIG